MTWQPLKGRKASGRTTCGVDSDGKTLQISPLDSTTLFIYFIIKIVFSLEIRFCFIDKKC